MSSDTTKVQFTVGKLDAGMAILLTQDHHQIEFPSILLPKTVTTGSVIDLQVTQNPSQEAEVQSRFLALQNTIRETFALKSPAKPKLGVRNVTQTSCVLEWEPIDIATAELKSLTLWRDGARLGNIPKPLATTTTKLSGLAIDTDYTFQLVLRTTAGTYSSDRVKVKTHKLTNLMGITVCEGTLPPEQHERLVKVVEEIGAKPLQKRVRIDTTHFICSVPEGEEWRRAREMNVPIVVVDWIEACQREGRIVGVRGYYLDADPALRPKPPTTSVSSPKTTIAPPRESVSEEKKLAENVVVQKALPAGTERVPETDQEIAAPSGVDSTPAPSSSAAPETEKSKEIETSNESTEKPATETAVAESKHEEKEEEKFDDVAI